MTPPDPEQPDQQEAVRRLLASSSTPEPLPADVAARLDDVLAGLVAEREHPVVTPMRRRRWPRVLVAAAGLTVFGLVGSQLLQTASQEQGDAATAGAAAEDAGDAEALEAPAEEAVPLAPEAPRDSAELDKGLDPGTDSDLGSGLDSGLDAGALRLQRSLAATTRGYVLDDRLRSDAANLPEVADRAGAGPASSLRACARSAPAGLSAVALGGDRYALVATSPAGRTSSVVTVYPCGGPRLPVASYVALGVR